MNIPQRRAIDSLREILTASLSAWFDVESACIAEFGALVRKPVELKAAEITDSHGDTCQATASRSDTPRLRGTCVGWDCGKGAGFVKPENGDSDIFVHFTMVWREAGGDPVRLHKGDQVVHRAW